MTKPSRERALRHESKGDELAASGRHEKALQEYRKALECDPGNSALYDKLISTRDALPGEWDDADFAESVSWAMKKQEQEHPAIRQVHARLSPEWEKATTLALTILNEPDDQRCAELTETLVGMGEIATRAIVGLLADLRRVSIRTAGREEAAPAPETAAPEKK